MTPKGDCEAPHSVNFRSLAVLTEANLPASDPALVPSLPQTSAGNLSEPGESRGEVAPNEGGFPSERPAVRA